MQFVQALNEQIETDLDKGIIVHFEITMLKSCTTKKYYYSFFNFLLLAIPYESCIHILAMEKFLAVYDKKIGIDAEDFFMESMCCCIFFSKLANSVRKKHCGGASQYFASISVFKDCENNQRNELRYCTDFKFE